MGKSMTLTLPAWTEERPAVAGFYMMANRFGQVGIVTVKRPVPDDKHVLYTSGGMMDIHRFGPYTFSGPIESEYLFPAELLAKHKAAVDDIPAAKVREQEAFCAQHPRSRKAKAHLEELRAELAAHVKKGGAS